MKKYQIEEKELHGGIQKIYKFPNNYGASVVRHLHSYGSEVGKWELAVIGFEEEQYVIDYSTPVTDDVLGRLDECEIDEVLQKIKEL